RRTASARSNGAISCRIRLLGRADEVAQAVPEQALRPVQPRHHGAKRNVEGSGELEVAELAKGLEGDGVTEVRRQARDLVTDGPLNVVPSGDILRIGASADERPHQLVER